MSGRPAPRRRLGRRAGPWAVLACVLALGAASCGGGGDDDAPPPDAERRAEGIEAGDCYDQPEGDDRGPVETVSCAEAHDNEAYAAFEADGEDYPGDARLHAESVDACIERFAGFVGVPYDSSGLDVDALTPTRLTWADGDRKVVCILFAANGEPLTGSAQGLAQ